MCGIVGYIGNHEAAPFLLDGMSKLEYRGYDSAGIAVYENNSIRVEKCVGRLDALRQKLAGNMPVGNVGIGHTRWATHGRPSDRNAHPHTDSSGKFVVVHNGIIENYLGLKEELIAKGHEFLSETDSEVVAHLMADQYDGDFEETVKKVLKLIKGSYSLVFMCEYEPDKIICTKKDNPLIIGLGEGENFIASDIPAIINHTRRTFIMSDGEIATVTADGVWVQDINGTPISKKVFEVNWNAEAAEKGGFEHFMLKEIYEQPKALRDTMTSRLDAEAKTIGFPELNWTAEELREINKIFIVACGTAYHAGIVGKYYLEQLARVPVEVDIASEFRYRDPILNKDDLVIIISQSGETSDTLAALKLAKSRGVPVLAIVNVVGSSIARAADYILYTYAGPEIAVASTKAYVVQMCVLYLFALRLAYARGKLEEAETKRLTAELLRAGEVIKPRLDDCEQIKYLASRFVNTQSCFFIGRGFDYALSLEGSLKLKEISYVHSDAYAAGELKHGTISLITDGVPVIALATQKQVYEKTISNAKETKSRGARVILFTTKDAVVPDGVADYIVRLDEYEDLLMPLQLIVPLQLFAYYMAVLRGCDVDKPRNLAKSVTVE